MPSAISFPVRQWLGLWGAGRVCICCPAAGFPSSSICQSLHTSLLIFCLHFLSYNLPMVLFWRNVNFFSLIISRFSLDILIVMGLWYLYLQTNFSFEVIKFLNLLRTELLKYKGFAFPNFIKMISYLSFQGVLFSN